MRVRVVFSQTIDFEMESPLLRHTSPVKLVERCAISGSRSQSWQHKLSVLNVLTRDVAVAAQLTVWDEHCLRQSGTSRERARCEPLAEERAEGQVLTC